MNIDLYESPNFWEWSTFDKPGLRHMKPRLESMFKNSPVHVQEIVPDEKYLLINGDRGILRFTIYGV